MRQIHLFIVLTVFGLAVPTGGHAGAHNGDGVAETAKVHGDDKPVPTPAAMTEPRVPVTGETVVYGRVGETELRGYLARPEQARPGLPALIVIHEWWGLNDNVRKKTERLAGEGYVALAVDLYDGQSAKIPKEAMQLMGGLMSATDAAEDNLRQAFSYLQQSQGAPRVGSIGWCLGGQWSLRTALILPDELDAAVMYYGTVTTDEEQLAALSMPVMGNFADTDPLIPLDSVEQFEASMKRLGKTVDIKVYENTRHAFANPSGLAYDAAAAEDAWERSTAFLQTHLQD